MKRLSPLLLSLFVLGLPACDITIEDGGGDTDGGGNNDDDDDDGEGSGSASSSDSAESGDPSSASAESGNPTDPGTSGDPTDSGTSGDPTDATASETSGDPTDATASGTSGDPTEGDSETSGDPTAGESGTVVCEDDGNCQACYDCSTGAGGACNDVAVTCANDNDCIEMSFCFDDCGVTSVTQDEYDACLLECEQTWPDGVDPFVDLIECAFVDACPASCN